MTDAAKIEYPTPENERAKELKAQINEKYKTLQSERAAARTAWETSRDALKSMGTSLDAVDIILEVLTANMKDLEQELYKPKF